MGEAPNTVDDAIDALGGTPTTEEVFLGTRAFSARRLAASAVRRVLGGGGDGGSSPFTVVGPFTVAWDTPDLVGFGPGVELAVLEIGSVLLGVTYLLREPWDVDGTLRVDVYKVDLSNNEHVAGFVSSPGDYVSPFCLFGENGNVSPTAPPRAVCADSEALSVRGYFGPDPDPPTEGESDLYLAFWVPT